MPKWVENCLSNMFGIRLYLSKSAILESFSIPHTLAYSVEAVQEANLATRYNPIFWECACLSVDAGSSGVSMGEAEDDEEDDDYTEQEQEKSVSTTNYGKVGKAVARALFRGAKVVPPTINEAEKDFYPNISNNTIVHSLLAISGVNIEFADKILANRPYTSIEDFMDKIEPTNIQMLNLVKSGSFDFLYPKTTRRNIMEIYLNYVAAKNISKKEKLTMSNVSKLIELKALPAEFDFCRRCFNYKKWIKANEKDTANKRYKIISEHSKDFFENNCLPCLTIGKEYDTIPNGYSVKSSSLDKVLDDYLTPLKEWLASPLSVELFFEAEKENYKTQIRNKYCLGTVSSWEMSALNCYYSEHELAHVNASEYGIVSFDSLSEIPEITGTKVGNNGKEYNIYRTSCLAGTVIDSDNTKHIVTIICHDGRVVDVKFSAWHYVYYNQKISEVDESGKKSVIENSWFARGTRLLILGFRRELSFVPRSDWEAGFSKPVKLIADIDLSGNLTLVNNRARGSDQ